MTQCRGTGERRESRKGAGCRGNWVAEGRDLGR